MRATEHAQGWSVGQLRAELVGVPDDTLVAVYVADTDGVVTRHVLTGAGYGPGVDATLPLFSAEFPLLARPQPPGDRPSPAHS